MCTKSSEDLVSRDYSLKFAAYTGCRPRGPLLVTRGLLVPGRGYGSGALSSTVTWTGAGIGGYLNFLELTFRALAISIPPDLYEGLTA